MSLPVRDRGGRLAVAVRKSGRTALRYLLIGLLALPLGGLTFATADNVAVLAHRERTEAAELIRTGVARVDDCDEHGPIGRHGFGWWSSCRVTVTWTDGTVEQRRTEHDFFQSDEVGQDIQVGEIRVRADDRSYHPVLIRAEWPNNGAYIIASIALSLLAALLLLSGVGYLLASMVTVWRG